jgi:aquaporin Z
MSFRDGDTARPASGGPGEALGAHWPEYAIEAAGLGLFMVAAGVAWTLLDDPGWPLAAFFAPRPILQRALMGLAMGGTATALIYSPWGRRSGAHFNPAVTLTFLRLGKLAPWDAAFYVLAQFLGGLAGVLLTYAALGRAFGDPPVAFIVTVPGDAGPWAAFLGEIAIAFAMMLMILYTSNRIPLMRFTGLFAGLLIVADVTFESPLSGFSMNPARTVASALPSGDWQGIWIYLTAPLLGMLAAVDAYRLLTREWGVICAKLNHNTRRPCIFHCGYKRRAVDVPALLATQPSLPVRHPLRQETGRSH